MSCPRLATLGRAGISVWLSCFGTMSPGSVLHRTADMPATPGPALLLLPLLLLHVPRAARAQVNPGK